LTDVLTVPVQAVQNGPEGKFLYVVNEASKASGKVSALPVKVRLIQSGLAVIEVEGRAVTPGLRVVMEGAQNLRPGSAVITEESNDTHGAAKDVRTDAEGTIANAKGRT
jgi:multidrug efflux pump subunit AcrA (membrane-fusion protein)